MDDHKLVRDLSVLADEYPIRVNPDQTVVWYGWSIRRIGIRSWERFVL